MSFITLHFIVFFILVSLLFFRTRRQGARVALLLTASCYFYMSFIPQYIYILGSVVVVDYFAGLQIERSAGTARRKWLLLSVAANVGILCVFKYYNFFANNLNDSFLIAGKNYTLPLLKMALPIGLSFHTFQALSYTIEVYRGNQKAEKRFDIYALYVMFYPQLVAGPIERPQNIIHQLKEYRPYNWDNVKEGLARMVWGFFKKAVVADRLAAIADHTFAHTSEASSLALFAGIFFYYFQIYGDFSGYCDIAFGAAKLMNIDIMDNFDQPIRSRSVSEFWRRWNISLYAWFFDYVFNPMVITLRNWRSMGIAFSLMVTFFLTGLWHGADWQYVVYGVLNGVALIYEYFTRRQRRNLFGRLPAWVGSVAGITATMLFTIFSRIFFRAVNIHAAWHYLVRTLSFRPGSGNIGMSRNELIFSCIVIAIMTLRERFIPGNKIRNNYLFYGYFIGMIAICYLFGNYEENQFIYFQF